MLKMIPDEAGYQIWSDLEEERLAKIRQRAHELYEARGREEGHDLEDWLQAEIDSEEPTPSETKV
jgi:hypothetical protein